MGGWWGVACVVGYRDGGREEWRVGGRKKTEEMKGRG